MNGLGGDSIYKLPNRAEIPGLKRFAPYPTQSVPASDRKFGAMLVETSDTEMKLTAFTVKIVQNVVQGVQRDQFTIPANAAMPAPMYRDLVKRSKGADVAAWQDFLFERRLLPEEPDRVFGPNTRTATESFRREQNLGVTGILDAATRESARALGFKPVESPDPD